LDVTGNPGNGHEELDAEGLAEFQHPAHLPGVDAVKPRHYVNTTSSDQQSTSNTCHDFDVKGNPATGHEELDTEGLAKFQHQAHLPGVDAVKPRHYVNTTISDQQSTSNTCQNMDVTGNRSTGHEELDAEGLAKFQHQAHLSGVDAVQPKHYANTTSSDQQSTSNTCHDLDVKRNPTTGYEELDAEGLAEFQHRAQLPRVYDAVKPRDYANTSANWDQQPTSSANREDYLDVTGDPLTGYEGLDAEGLAEFQRRAHLPRVYDAAKPRHYVNTTSFDQQSPSDTCRDLDVTQP